MKHKYNFTLSSEVQLTSTLGNAKPEAPANDVPASGLKDRWIKWAYLQMCLLHLLCPAATLHNCLIIKFKMIHDAVMVKLWNIFITNLKSWMKLKKEDFTLLIPYMYITDVPVKPKV